MTRLLALLIAASALSGCTTMPAADDDGPAVAACPVGQENLRTAQLFLGRKNVGPVASAADLQRFIDVEITPKFPDGVTVVEGGAQWQGAENLLMRDAAKIVHIVLPAKGDQQNRIELVRKAYRTQFRQESVLVVTQPACVAF